MVLGGARGGRRGRARWLAQFGGMPRLQPLVGLIVILAIAYALLDQPPRDRPADGRLGAGLQIALRAARAEDRRRASGSSRRSAA